MRQVTYISTVRQDHRADMFRSVERVSQANNARDALSGLLMFDGMRFLQVIEGPEPALSATLDRIRADGRHFGLVVLTDRAVEERAFGGWAMLCRDVKGEGDLVAMLRPFLAGADPNTRATFQSFAAIRDAA